MWKHGNCSEGDHIYFICGDGLPTIRTSALKRTGDLTVTRTTSSPSFTQTHQTEQKIMMTLGGTFLVRGLSVASILLLFVSFSSFESPTPTFGNYKPQKKNVVILPLSSNCICHSVSMFIYIQFYLTLYKYLRFTLY